MTTAGDSFCAKVPARQGLPSVALETFVDMMVHMTSWDQSTVVPAG